MIIRFGLLICVSASLLAPAAASGDEAPHSEPGSSPAAQVTIPYQDFKRLLDAATIATKPEDSPDIAGAITRAVIKLSFDPAHPAGEAEFDINTFGRKWVFVPFFGLDLPITNVICDAAIVPRDDELVALSVIENRKKLDAPQRVDLSRIVERVVNHIRERPSSVKINFKPNSQMIVMGDEFLLENAVRNLLQNAIEFSPSTGTVTVSQGVNPES